jgi:hypothetical protein
MHRDDEGGTQAIGIATSPAIVALREAHRAGHLDRAHDELRQAHAMLPADDPDAPLALAWTVALDLVTTAAARSWSPRATVTDIATELAGHLGVADAALELDAWMERAAHADAPSATPTSNPDTATVTAMRAAGQTSRYVLATTPDALEPAALRSALAEAYDDIDRLRAERDAFEDAAVAGEGARRLAIELGAELERDEWIRARIRRTKSTLPMRVAIRVRRLARARSGPT